MVGLPVSLLSRPSVPRNISPFITPVSDSLSHPLQPPSYTRVKTNVGRGVPESPGDPVGSFRGTPDVRNVNPVEVPCDPGVEQVDSDVVPLFRSWERE